MPKYLIERDMPGAGALNAVELREASRKSAEVLREMGSEIQWLHSYVTADRLYCLYIAPDEATVQRHAELSGFPASRISRVRATIDPTTAE
ncbi:DUF4242 domain-containing protein [Caldimonas sp. KR1-144]|uniref:DUF4242 domain-containing protein n=1 Tax=Caldimonas sp. KR1-144 TaxID=3400911 RepID=UPI003BFDA11B